jgi:hypothetical protein
MRSTALRIALLLVLALFLSGCGGGGSGGGSEEGGGSGGQQEEQQAGGEETTGSEGEEANGGGQKIALGQIASVNAEAGRFAIEPSTEDQGEEPITFKLTQGGTVTLEGEEVELSAMEEGQQAQVEYVVLKDLNRARKVELFGGESTTG